MDDTMMSMTERAINDARSDALNEGIGIGEERGIKIGEERGIGKGIVIAVCGYIRNTGATIDEAFDKHSIPDDIRKEIREDIEKELLN